MFKRFITNSLPAVVPCAAALLIMVGALLQVYCNGDAQNVPSEQGPKGEQGPPGIQGPKGEQGLPGTHTISTIIIRSDSIVVAQLQTLQIKYDSLANVTLTMYGYFLLAIEQIEANTHRINTLEALPDSIAPTPPTLEGHVDVHMNWVTTNNYDQFYLQVANSFNYKIDSLQLNIWDGAEFDYVQNPPTGVTILPDLGVENQDGILSDYIRILCGEAAPSGAVLNFGLGDIDGDTCDDIIVDIWAADGIRSEPIVDGKARVYAREQPFEPGKITVSWLPNTEEDLAGYKIYFGRESDSYTTVINVGLTTRYILEDLLGDVKWYFAVTAYDKYGNESGYSEEAWIIPN